MRIGRIRPADLPMATQLMRPVCITKEHVDPRVEKYASPARGQSAERKTSVEQDPPE
jgi:hypothetical protein